MRAGEKRFVHRRLSRSKKPARARSGRSNERLHGSIAREIGVAIVSGRIGPGERLENEVDSSQRMSVSRTAYREAVRILAAKGLVASRPKLGTRVCPRSALLHCPVSTSNTRTFRSMHAAATEAPSCDRLTAFTYG